MTTTNGTNNGTATIEYNNMTIVQTETELQTTSESATKQDTPTAINSKKEKKTRTKKPRLNAIQTVDVVLDAGSHNTKTYINGYYRSFTSVFKQITTELPSGMAGCFSYKDKNYIVGSLSEGFPGKAVYAYQDNKISKLDIWLIGALAYDCDFLDELIADKTRINKYKNLPIRLDVSLKLLSLSSSKKGMITKIFGDVGSFIYRNKVFEVRVNNLECENGLIFSEGYGAALTAREMLEDDQTEFYILDLGGGTLTLTQYDKGRKIPNSIHRSVATGGGMQIVAETIYTRVTNSDLGGQEFTMKGIFAALKACKMKGDNYYTPYSLGRKNIDISPNIPQALEIWIQQNPTIKSLLAETRTALNSGLPVFATGGGFASKIIADWLTEYLKEEIEEAQFQVLEKPQSINVTGMKLLETSAN